MPYRSTGSNGCCVWIRPRDELARAAGLEIAARGGVVVDDTCATAEPHVWAIGDSVAASVFTIGFK